MEIYLAELHKTIVCKNNNDIIFTINFIHYIILKESDVIYLVTNL